MTTRRRFLQGAGAGGALIAVGRFGFHSAFAADAPSLPIPKLIDARSAGGAIALTARRGTAAFFSGQSAQVLGYGGGYQGFLGPTLRVHRGDTVDMAVTNALDWTTTAHWHGLLVPSGLDGGPHQRIAPGATWRPRLPIDQPATTLWYHAHPHPGTAEQVYFGLVGMLIVTDGDEQALGLPSDYGADDLPLIVQDRAFDADGQLVYGRDPMTAMHGMRGDVILVNGAPTPTARPPAGWTRLRLLNAANARFFDLSFDDGRAFQWIGTDGGLLARPVERRSLLLAPAQRAEVLVDFSDGRPATMVTAPVANLPDPMGMTMGGAPGFGVFDGPRAVIRFEPDLGRKSSGGVPARLVERERLDRAQATGRRRLVLTMGPGGMMGMGRGMMGGGGAFLGINGDAFDMSRVDARVPFGAVEIWEVSGQIMAHPFHMHGVQFEVLSRNGQQAGPEDQGFRDTIVVDGPVELIARFVHPAEDEPFVYHCHILEHEDGGMMGQYMTA